MFQAGRLIAVVGVILLIAIATASLQRVSPSARAQQDPSPGASQTAGFDAAINQNAQRMIEEGRKIFRYDTFGDETFWGDQLQLHKAIVGEKLGGVGPGVSPKMALSLGLKVDAAAVPPDVAA